MDKQVLRRGLSLIPYGIYIVASREGDRHVTMLATWIAQASFHPPMISLAVESDSRMLRAIRATGVFSANILPEGGKGIAALFLKPAESVGGSIAGRPFSAGPGGSCILADAVAVLECRVAGETPAGDHTIVLGEVLHVETKTEGHALTLRETGWKYQK